MNTKWKSRKKVNECGKFWILLQSDLRFQQAVLMFSRCGFHFNHRQVVLQHDPSLFSFLFCSSPFLFTCFCAVHRLVSLEEKIYGILNLVHGIMTWLKVLGLSIKFDWLEFFAVKKTGICSCFPSPRGKMHCNVYINNIRGCALAPTHLVTAVLTALPTEFFGQN